MEMGEIDDVINIGGKEPDGSPSGLGRWTFQTRIVREEVLDELRGRVLNACAGKTELHKENVEIVRNDINPDIDADCHCDVMDLPDHFGIRSFDVVVFDPPFDQDQADEHYDGENVTRIPTARKRLASLVSSGGSLVQFGWSMWGMADYSGHWVRDRVVLFRRGVVERPPVFMVVDRRAQSYL